MSPSDGGQDIETDRRSIVKLSATLGALGITGLAGCSGDGGGDGSDGGSDGGSNGGSDGDSDGGSGTDDGGMETDTGLPRGGTFNVGAQQGIETMSPFRGFLADYLLGEAMYDRLTRVNQDLEVEPNLATDWEVNSDYTVFTFMLDESATFANTDGQSVTADDVVATYDYLTSDEFSGAASSLSGVETVEKVDETTVEITLGSSDLSFPKRISETGGAFFVAPKSVLEDDPSQLEETDYGSGPLVLTEWDQKNSITFEAKSDYHIDGEDGDPLPYIDGMVWNILSDEIQRVNALSDGTVDAVSRIAPNVTDRAGEDTTFVNRASGLQFPIVLDTTVEPFDNGKVRKAIKHALDREQFVEAVSGDGVLGHHAGITPVHSEYNDDLPVDDTFGTTAQTDEAEQLLSEAGYDGGFEVQTFHYDDGYPQKETIAQLFQQQMAEVGIEFEINRLTEETWLSDYWNQEGNWYITNYSTRVLGSTVPRLALRSDGPWNEANWSNADYDAAYGAATTATDEETATENFDKMQEINHREGAWVGTYHPSIYGGHKEYVHNYELYPTEVKDLISWCAVDK